MSTGGTGGTGGATTAGTAGAASASGNQTGSAGAAGAPPSAAPRAADAGGCACTTTHCSRITAWTVIALALGPLARRRRVKRRI
jgi:hypothetical protein